MGEFGWTYPVPDDFDHDYPDASKWFYDDRVLATQDVGVMVRAAMSVVLETGQAVTLGVWVGVADEDRWVYSRFEDDWGGFTFRGFLLNASEPWPEVFFARGHTRGDHWTRDGASDRHRARGAPTRAHGRESRAAPRTTCRGTSACLTTWPTCKQRSERCGSSSRAACSSSPRTRR